MIFSTYTYPRYLQLSLLVIVLLSPATAFSLPEDKDQPINISADAAQKNEKKGLTTYTGDVVIIQGSVRITGDKVTIHEQNGEVYKVVADGKPAHFRQKPDKDSDFVIAEGNNMDYRVSKEKLTIKGNAHLKQEGRTTTSNLITYDMKAAQVNAGNDGGRVNMVIPSKNK